MKRTMGICVVLLIGWMAGAGWAGELYSVGETWKYQHQGAVPFRPPDYTIVGDRLREVVSVRGENEEKRWLIVEKWGDEDNWAGKRCVNADRMYDRIESDEDRVMTIEPAYPFDLINLKPDETKTYKTTFKVNENWSIPITMTAKRVQNETLKVPAGEFEQCIHVMIDEESTFTNQNGETFTIKTKREHWYSPKVNGLVKEIYTLTRPDGSTDTGTSELKSYSKEKKEP